MHPKEGDNFKAANISIVYQLQDGKKRRYPSARSFLHRNSPFNTTCEKGGILICDASTVNAIPDGQMIALAPNEKAKVKRKANFWNTIFRKDKASHLLGYFIWTLLLLYSLQGYAWSWNKKVTYTLIFASILGTLVELVQYYFIHGRDAEWLDWCANMLGTSLALILYKKTTFIQSLR